MVKQKMWVLYDPANKTATEPMSMEDMQMALMKLKTRHIDRFFISCDGWPKWRHMRAFLDSDESPFMAMNLATGQELTQTVTGISILNMKPANREMQESVERSFSDIQLGDFEDHETTVESSIQIDGDQVFEDTAVKKNSLNFNELKAKNNQKTATPLEKNKIELLLENKKGQAFRCQAKNISLSGTYAEKAIPAAFLQDYFDIIIINNFMNDHKLSRLKLKAKIKITDSAQYIVFDNMNDMQKESLRAMLAYYIRIQQKITSKAG